MSPPRRDPSVTRTNRASAADRSVAQVDSGATRRFEPSSKRVTDGGRVFGLLIADQRERLGLSQTELAARVRSSRAVIERIESGHPPGAELRQRLSDSLFPEPAPNPVRRLASSHPIDRLAQGVPLRNRLGAVRVRGNRRLWAAVAAVVLIALLLILGTRILSGDDGAPSDEPSVAISAVIGPPAAIHRARVEAHKAAVAEARREAAARRARAREQAAAAAAATAARKRAAKQAVATNGSSSTTSPPVAAPVTPSPSPSGGGGGGGGGGGSSAPAPQLGHGIGSG
jgi:DNA-binding XRE family transcriptional regulator